MTDFDILPVGLDRVHVLDEGYAGLDGDERLSGIVTIPCHGAPSGPCVHA